MRYQNHVYVKRSYMGTILVITYVDIILNLSFSNYIAIYKVTECQDCIAIT